MWFPLFFGMLFFAPIPVFGLFLGGMCAIGAGELLKATQTPEKQGYFLVTKGAAVLISVGFALWEVDLTILSVSILLTTGLFLLAIIHFSEESSVSYQTLFTSIFAGIIFPMFFSALIVLRNMEWGQYLVLLPVVTSFGADSGAYFVGVFFGKHRGITKVSPNKSLEGYFGGPMLGTVVMVLYAYLLQRFIFMDTLTVNYTTFIICGFVGSLMTALGDLSFSLIKRQTGIKDYGTLIAGHGGICDRFDGMTFSAPLIWLVIQLFPPF